MKPKIAPADAARGGWEGVTSLRAARAAQHEIVRRVGAFVVTHEREQCSSEFLLVDGAPYLADRCEMRAFPIAPKDPGLRTMLGTRYGLGGTDPLTRGVVDFCDTYARAYGRPVAGARFAYWDAAERKYYASRRDGSTYCMDGKEIDVQHNGEGPVLFLDDGEGEDVEPDIGPHGELAEALTGDLQYSEATPGGGLEPWMQRQTFLTWMFAVGFAERFPHKQVLLVDGDHGSGKTTAIQRVQITLTGRSLPMQLGQDDAGDFPVMLLSAAPIALIDNQDTPLEWLRDAIAAYVTSGGWVKRQFYTRTEAVRIFPQSFIAITSRNPQTYRRPDIADRCVLLRLEMRERRLTSRAILDNIRERRPRLFGEWLWTINRIIAAETEAKLPEDFPWRLADFAQFSYLVACATGLDEDKATAMLRAAQSERDALVLEDEPLLPLIEKLLGSASETSWYSSAELCDAFASLVTSTPGTKFAYNPYSLGRRLRSLVQALRGRGVAVEHRTVHGKTSWRFATCVP